MIRVCDVLQLNHLGISHSAGAQSVCVWPSEGAKLGMLDVDAEKQSCFSTFQLIWLPSSLFDCLVPINRTLEMLLGDAGE